MLKRIIDYFIYGASLIMYTILLVKTTQFFDNHEQTYLDIFLVGDTLCFYIFFEMIVRLLKYVHPMEKQKC